MVSFLSAGEYYVAMVLPQAYLSKPDFVKVSSIIVYKCTYEERTSIINLNQSQVGN